MTQPFARWLVAKLLLLPYLLVVAGPGLLLFYLTDNKDKPLSALTAIGALEAFAAFFASLWLSKTTARYLIVENLMFLDAVKRTWLDARLRLAFVPVIGLLFTPDEDKTKYDDDDDILMKHSSPPTQE